jgi:pyridoxine 5-phosphate synthase
MDAQLHLAVGSAAAFRRLSGGVHPSTVSVALLAELAGAHCISYDLRSPDRNDAERDARLLRACLAGRFDIVVASGPDLMDLAFSMRPNRLTLAPEKREGGSGAGGVDAHMLRDSLRRQVLHLRDAGIEVGVRIDPDIEQCKALHRAEAEVAVLNCDAFVRARTAQERLTETTRIADTATLANRLGLRVGIVGDIDLVSIETLARIAHIDEFQVGHACLARGMLRGIEQAVLDFSAGIDRGRRRAF